MSYTREQIEEAVKAYETALQDPTNLAPQYFGYPIAILRTYKQLLERDTYSRSRFTKYAVFDKPGTNIFSEVAKARSTNDYLKQSISSNQMTSIAQISEVSNPSNKYTFEIMPAIKSYTSSSNHGMQAPGAGHGTSWKSSLNIAKLNVPGSSPYLS